MSRARGGADAGLLALATVRLALAPEAARVREEPRGFRWWPHAHAMSVTAGVPRADGAAVVAVETPLLAGVGAHGPAFAKLATYNAREPGLSALRLDTERAEVSMRASVVTRPGDGGVTARRLAHAALLQVGEALRAADELLVALTGATPIEERPPGKPAAHGSGAWPVVEQAEAWRAYAAGAAARVGDLERALSRLGSLEPAPWTRVTRAAHGLDAELSVGAAALSGAAALLRLSVTQPHPRLGAGVVAALIPPAALEPEAERAAATAALLNEAESREWTGFDQCGAWCVHAAAGLAHVAFVPALAVEESTLETLAWQAGARARWATAFAARVGALRTQAQAGSVAVAAAPVAPREAKSGAAPHQ